MKNPVSSSLKLALVFLVFGITWIVGTDLISLNVTNNNISLYNTLQHSKGILFMVLAAFLIWFVSRRLYRNIEQANKQQDEALKRYNILGLATNDAIWDVNLLTGETYTNKTLQEMFGYAEAALKDNRQWWKSNIHPNDKERVQKLMHDILRTGGTIWQDEYRFRSSGDVYRVVYDRGFIMRDKQGKAYRIIGAMQDVTEQRVLQQKLVEEQERHRQEISQKIFQAEEGERKKLGEELHDNINQLLGVVKLYVQHAQINPGMRQELLVKCSDYIGQTIEEIRNLSRSLLPPALQEHGLMNSLYQMTADIRQAKGMEIEVYNEGFDETKLSQGRQLMIYRIIQEQMNNVLKHSGAGQVDIKLEMTPDKVKFAVKDNGAGFDTEKNKPGMGLINIRSRLEVANGQMKIISAPGEGCVLEVEFLRESD